MAILNPEFFVEVNNKISQDHKYTTYTTINGLCNPLILFSKVDGTALAICQIIASNRDASAIIAPFHNHNINKKHKQPFIQKFQSVFGSLTNQPIKNGIEIAFAITNLSHKNNIKFNITRQQNDPNNMNKSRINQINILRPFQTCIVNCDRDNNNRTMILEKLKNVNNNFVTVEEDEKQCMNNNVLNGMNVILSVCPPENDQELVSKYKDTVWKIDDCFTIKRSVGYSYSFEQSLGQSFEQSYEQSFGQSINFRMHHDVLNRIPPEVLERQQRKITPWIPNKPPLEKPIIQHEFVAGVCFEREIYYPGGRYENCGYVPSTYKPPIPMYSHWYSRENGTPCSYGDKGSGFGLSLPSFSLPSLPKISFKRHQDKVNSVNTHIIEKSHITVIRSGERGVVKSKIANIKFTNKFAQAIVGISINDALMFVNGNVDRELLHAKALDQLKWIESKNYQFLNINENKNDENKQNENDEDEDEDECVVCLDDIGDNRCILLPCAHNSYDFKCIDKILKTKEKTCPLCKLTIVALICNTRE